MCETAGLTAASGQQGVLLRLHTHAHTDTLVPTGEPEQQRKGEVLT